MSTRHRGVWPLVALTALAGCDEDDGMTPPVETTFEVRVENVSATYDFPVSGSFDTPVGGTAPGPILPGGVFEFEFSAPPGARLSLATMMAQSNDLFYAPDGDGIALWDMGGNQVAGDVTAQIALWDAGTEANEEPGLGADQAPRQSGPDTGADDPDDTVRPAPDTYGNLPAVSDVISVTLTSTGPNSWVARIENVGDAATLGTSDGGMHPVPLSPGVFVVHTEPDPLFTSAEPDRDEGLEGIAEDGAAATLAADLAGRTGATGILSPRGVRRAFGALGPLRCRDARRRPGARGDRGRRRSGGARDGLVRGHRRYRGGSLRHAGGCLRRGPCDARGGVRLHDHGRSG
jgi:hypothetical protein